MKTCVDAGISYIIGTPQLDVQKIVVMYKSGGLASRQTDWAKNSPL